MNKQVIYLIIGVFLLLGLYFLLKKRNDTNNGDDSTGTETGAEGSGSAVRYCVDENDYSTKLASKYRNEFTQNPSIDRLDAWTNAKKDFAFENNCSLDIEPKFFCSYINQIPPNYSFYHYVSDRLNDLSQQYPNRNIVDNWLEAFRQVSSEWNCIIENDPNESSYNYSYFANFNS